MNKLLTAYLEAEGYENIIRLDWFYLKYCEVQVNFYVQSGNINTPNKKETIIIDVWEICAFLFNSQQETEILVKSLQLQKQYK